MHALSAHAWDYSPALQAVFESVGLDYLYHVNDFNKERFNVFMCQFSSTKLRKEIIHICTIHFFCTYRKPCHATSRQKITVNISFITSEYRLKKKWSISVTIFSWHYNHRLVVCSCPENLWCLTPPNFGYLE
jgi:hypothetical protein